MTIKRNDNEMKWSDKISRLIFCSSSPLLLLLLDMSDTGTRCWLTITPRKVALWVSLISKLITLWLLFHTDRQSTPSALEIESLLLDPVSDSRIGKGNSRLYYVLPGLSSSSSSGIHSRFPNKSSAREHVFRSQPEVLLGDDTRRLEWMVDWLIDDRYWWTRSWSNSPGNSTIHKRVGFVLGQGDGIRMKRESVNHLNSRVSKLKASFEEDRHTDNPWQNRPILLSPNPLGISQIDYSGLVAGSSSG